MSVAKQGGGILRLIIDTDCGVDDAQALMMAFAHPTAKVEMITAVGGNVGVDQVIQNVHRVQNECQGSECLKAPVYRGATKPLISLDQNHTDASYWHGNDGLGDAPDDEDLDQKRRKVDALASAEHASVELVRKVRENPGEFTVVALGPLTNIALAVRIEPQFGKLLKDFVVMGTARDGSGNVTHTAEFNTYADPEAAAVVFADIHCPVLCVDWRATLDHPLKMDWFESLCNSAAPHAPFLKRISTLLIERIRESRWSGDDFLIPDPLAMAVALEAGAVKERQNRRVTVELGGSITRGMVVAHQPIGPAETIDENAGHEVTFVTKIEMQEVMKLFELAVGKRSLI